MNFILPEWMPNIHPLIIHFPIVLLLLAVLLHLTALIVWKLPWLRTITLAVFILGLLTLILTYLSGRQAADSVSITTVAINTLSKHADLALWTLIYFGVLTVLHLGIKFLKIYDKKSISIALLVLGLFGLVLVVQTADLGGQLVYKYGVGVQAGSQVKIKEYESAYGIDSTGFIKDEDGSWQLLPNKKINSAFSNELIWLEGSIDDINVQLKILETDAQVIELNLTGNPVLFIAGDDLASVLAEIEINLCEFNGTVSLVHHVQDRFNYDYFSIDNNQFKLGRIENGIDKILSEKSITHNCWINLRVVGDGRHFRGYLDDLLLLHGHQKDLPPGVSGLRIDGSGIIYFKKLKVQSLLAENG